MSRTDGDRKRVLKDIAHDLGNLSYRLGLLTENLKAAIPESTSRVEAIALLEDTAKRLRVIVEKLDDAG